MSTNPLVLDANILIRAVLGTKTRALLLTHTHSTRFYTPDACYADAEKYLPLLAKKRGVKSETFMDVWEAVQSLIEPIDVSLYRLYEKEAMRRIASRDVDDWTVIATALLLNAPIWQGILKVN